MPISRSHSKKAPTQLPNKFFECEQNGKGTVREGGENIPEKLSSGKLREEIYGRKSLNKQ